MDGRSKTPAKAATKQPGKGSDDKNPVKKEKRKKAAGSKAEDPDVFFERVKKAFEVNQPIDIVSFEDLISLIPCSAGTFYAKIPSGSEMHSKVVDMIRTNRVAVRRRIRKRWLTEGVPVTDIALMKLVGSEEDAHRLNGSKTDQSVNVNATISYANLSDEELATTIQRLITKVNADKPAGE